MLSSFLAFSSFAEDNTNADGQPQSKTSSEESSAEGSSENKSSGHYTADTTSGSFGFQPHTANKKYLSYEDLPIVHVRATWNNTFIVVETRGLCVVYARARVCVCVCVCVWVNEWACVHARTLVCLCLCVCPSIEQPPALSTKVLATHSSASSLPVNASLVSTMHILIAVVLEHFFVPLLLLCCWWFVFVMFFFFHYLQKRTPCLRRQR